MPMIAIVFALSTSLFFTVLVAAGVAGVGDPWSDSAAVSVKTGTGLSASGPPAGDTSTHWTVEPSL